VRALEASGAKVCVVTADVADPEALQVALEQVRVKLGQVRGVLHTAGVLDDDLIVLKSASRAHKVLEPKVAGTIALAEALSGVSLDFFILYSSVSATLGLAGQCDYASANAYLNAFAARRSSELGERCVAVGWPAWQDAGMAADLAAQTFRRDGGRPVEHLFLDRCVRESPGVASYVTEFEVDKHWLLSEHRVRGGGALIPGTGYLELARAALTDGSRPDSPVEMRDVVFMSPFFVGDDAPRSLRLDLRATEDGWNDFVITSGGPEFDGEEHVRGVARLLREFSADDVRVGPIRKRCKKRVDMPDGPKPDPNLDFGERWGNLRRVDVGSGEALATLELAPAFAAEVSETRLHPALLDFATAGAQMLVPGNEEGEGFYVPVGYLSLRFSGTLSHKLYSHIRLKSAPSEGELAVYDVCVFQPNGQVVLEVEEFTMRRIEDRDSFKFEPVRDVQGSANRPDALAQGMARGVSSEDGVAVLRDVLSTRVPAELIVSPVDYREVVAQANEPATGPRLVLTIGDGEEIVGDDFEAPRTELEKAIASIWSEALGVKSIGLDSDFFKLGGHSLVAIRITSRLNQTFGVDLPLRALFEGPSVRKLAALVEELAGVYVPDGETPDPKELKRLAGDHPLVNSGDAIPLLDRSEPLRPSFAQEGLWFLDQLQPGNVAYNIPMAIRLRGKLDVVALEKSLTEIVARHESTRTHFSAEGGQPRLVIGAAAPIALHVLDVQDGGTAEGFASQSAARAFDLATGSLFRAELGRLGKNDHVLVLTMHHIVSDEWSLELLYQELGPLYDTWKADASAVSPLEPLPIQYADFSAWRRERMTKELFEEELEYWKSALEGARTTLELPADRPRPPVQTFNGARAIHEFSADTHRQLHEVAREYGVTPFVAMLGAFHAFLYRLTGQDDIILGSPSSTRTRTEAENLIGFFVNTLVLRGDLSGRPTFADVLSRTRATAMDAFANSDLPFDSLVRELSIDRDPSRNPVFQVMFALFPSVREIAMSGLEIESLDVDTGGAQIDLTLYVSDGADSLRGIFEYNADLFDKETIVSFSKCFETLLSSMLSDPDEEVDVLPFVATEVRQALDSFNPIVSEYERDACLHTLFEAKRKKTPSAIALEASDATWTYRELDERSNQIAGHLRQIGVCPGDYVGISSSRTSHLVSGLFGILKAGATYLPLDPAFPKERLAFMLDDTSAPVILTEASLKDELPPSRARIVCLDSDWDEIATQPTRKPPEQAGATDLAYVIYTSGSTGKPKGVQVPHGAVVNFLQTMAERPGVGPDDTLLAVTTISFDISVLEIFLPLSVGAKLVMVDKEVSTDGRALAAKMAACGATIMQATPATWRLLYQSGWAGDDTLKVLCGGEALPKDLAGQLVGSVASLWNMYGPTETTIWSTVAHVTDPEDITIGTPIANTFCYVLDANGCLVPPGTPGVLWIGGEGVTRGYVNRDDLTAERFLPDPFRSEGARMYNTGDLVRWRRTGALEYLSRVDTQVKVRGFRIELGEIEAVLSRAPGVRAAVVSAHDFGDGDVRLVGYVVPSGAPPEVAALKSALREHVPDYMVPSLWQTLEALPLTANGKVDRKALPVPGASEKTVEVEEPTSTAEKLLAEVWRDVLKTPDVGVQENFFDLGGHSLLAMQMIARVADATGHRFNPLEVSLQTLGQLAAALPTDSEDAPKSEPAAEEASAQRPGAAVAADPTASHLPAASNANGAPAPGEHRRLLKKVVRRFTSRIMGQE
jgi:amino acid adenylation domain-containing protein